MRDKIIMGNDEFILYIRKQNSNCNKTNDQLGKIIWIWLRDRGGRKTEENTPCLWGNQADNVDELLLPKTACQFEFRRNLLPDLYLFLESI